MKEEFIKIAIFLTIVIVIFNVLNMVFNEYDINRLDKRFDRIDSLLIEHQKYIVIDTTKQLQIITIK